jgi:hypothetical protein
VSDLDDLSPDTWVEALAGPAHEADLLLLASIDPRTLVEPLTKLAYVQALDRISSLVASLRCDALVAVAGERSSGVYLSEVHVEHEVAVARRTSRYAAGRSVELARSLATSFPWFAAALREGLVSEAHCGVLVERTRPVVGDEVLARIERRLLPKARRLPVGEFAREVAKAVSVLDPDAAGRFRRARETRRVWSRPLDDGLGFLGVVDDWATISALQATVDHDARELRKARCGAVDTSSPSDANAAVDDDASLDSCRADALAARVLGRVDDDGTVSFDRSDVPVTVNVVIDLDTLRDERDGLVLVDGQPVPAQMGREIADGAKAWRRMVTDPVAGHLLDYGTTTYLPGPLRRYVLARDGECRAPGCSARSAVRLQLDHVVPFPAGPSAAHNSGAVCTTDHQLKTDGLVSIVDSRADGSCTWITGWGQRVEIPARPFLDDPAPPPAPGAMRSPALGTAAPPGLDTSPRSTQAPRASVDGDPPPF